MKIEIKEIREGNLSKISILAEFDGQEYETYAYGYFRKVTFINALTKLTDILIKSLGLDVLDKYKEKNRKNDIITL